jgi:hypothetical protein
MLIAWAARWTRHKRWWPSHRRSERSLIIWWGSASRIRSLDGSSRPKVPLERQRGISLKPFKPLTRFQTRFKTRRTNLFLASHAQGDLEAASVQPQGGPFSVQGLEGFHLCRASRVIRKIFRDTFFRLNRSLTHLAEWHRRTLRKDRAGRKCSYRVHCRV